MTKIYHYKNIELLIRFLEILELILKINYYLKVASFILYINLKIKEKIIYHFNYFHFEHCSKLFQSFNTPLLPLKTTCRLIFINFNCFPILFSYH